MPLIAPLLNDVQIALLRDALDGDDLRELFAELSGAARRALAGIRAAVDANDLGGARRAAHVLKGVAGSFGAARLAALAEVLESDGPSVASIALDLASVEATIDLTALALAEVVTLANGGET